MAFPLIAAALAGGLAVAALSERHKARPTSEAGATGKDDGVPTVTKTENSGVGTDVYGDPGFVKQTDTGVQPVDDPAGHAGNGATPVSTQTRVITDPAPPPKSPSGIKLLQLDRAKYTNREIADIVMGSGGGPKTGMMY